jgi:hypothetical protein
MQYYSKLAFDVSFIINKSTILEDSLEKWKEY